jgi:hypothetical protein
MNDSEPLLKISETNLLVIFIVFIVLFRFISIYFQNRSISIGSNISKNVTLVVLGDIGRSPRMQYHALSFAQNGWTVDFIGYDGINFLFNLVNYKLSN